MIEDEERYTKDYTLNKVLHLGQNFKYIFDFGDEFTFQCKLLKEIDEITEDAFVIRSKGDAPMQYGEWDDDEDEDDYIFDNDNSEDDEEEDLPFDEVFDDNGGTQNTILFEFPE